MAHNKIILSDELSEYDSYNQPTEGVIELGIKSDFQVGNLCIYEKYYKNGYLVNYVKETCYIKSIDETDKGKILNISPVFAVDYSNGILDKAYYKKYGYTLVLHNGNWKEVVSVTDGSDSFVYSSDTLCEMVIPLESNIPTKRIYVEDGKVLEGYQKYKHEIFDTGALPDWCLSS